MAHVLQHAADRGFTGSVIEAQLYAIPFYERLGYVAEGPEYDDGSGILHRVMRLTLTGGADALRARAESCLDRAAPRLTPASGACNPIP